ncbi:MAG: HD domain-containing protein [Spirochaetia bacterium]|nr:HD domain-containing protein [Spirochaetia bacterium]
MKYNLSKNKLIRILLFTGLTVFLLLDAIFYKVIYDNYRFAKREIKGIRLIQDILPILYAMQNYRGREQILLYGHGKPASTSEEKVKLLRNNVASNILKYVHNNDAPESSGKLKEIARQLETHSYNDYSSAIEHFLFHSRQIQEIIGLIQAIHYQSNLMLDPQLESYYLESIGVIKMTLMTENIAKIRGLFSGFVLQLNPENKYHHLIEQEFTLLKNNSLEISSRYLYLSSKNSEIAQLLDIPMSSLLKQITDYENFFIKAINSPPGKISAEDAFSKGTIVIEEAQKTQNMVLERVKLEITNRSKKIIKEAILFSVLILITLGALLWGIRFFMLQNKKISSLLKAITEGRQHLIYAGSAEEIYMNLCNILVDHGGYIVIGVFLIKHNAAKELVPISICGKAADYLKSIQVSWGDNELGRGPGGTSVRTRKTQIFNDIKNNPDFKPWRDKALSYGIRSNATIPLIYQDKTIGAIAIYSDKKNAFLPNEIKMIQDLMEDCMFNIAALETRAERDKAMETLNQYNSILKKKVMERTKKLVETQDATILSLASLVESRDNETGNHILRTREYVKILLNYLKDHPETQEELTPEKIDQIYKSSPLHDIGKIGIADAILRKPGKLTKKEFDIMKKHTLIGATAINRATQGITSTGFLDTAREIILHHHEKWDGSGYPIGLKGKDIPVSARIMSLADVYDALISKRVYKDAFSHAEACSIIEKSRGTNFDPTIVDAFREKADEFEKIAKTFGD